MNRYIPVITVKLRVVILHLSIGGTLIIGLLPIGLPIGGT